jgi:uncharacterized protein (TIGR03086 family)
MDARPHNRQALDLNQQVVDQLAEAQFDLPTPCPPWAVRELLSHMVSQHLRFAAVARGEDPEQACPLDKAELGEDPVATYREASELVTESFATGDYDAVRLLPEIGTPLPLSVLISFHTFDFVVHGWDLAVSIGAPYAPPAELSSFAYKVGELIPDTSRAPGGAFAPVVEVGSDADELAKLLGLAGRTAGWTTPTT